MLAFRSEPYTVERRSRIRECVEHGTPEMLCRLHADLGEWFAEATLALLESAGVAPEEIAAVGSHGHTVWHILRSRAGAAPPCSSGTPPPWPNARASTWWRTCARATWPRVVRGAPLVSFADRILFSQPGRRRALQNLGGIANVTWLAPRGSDEPLLAFDTGPATCSWTWPPSRPAEVGSATTWTAASPRKDGWTSPCLRACWRTRSSRRSRRAPRDASASGTS